MNFEDKMPKFDNQVNDDKFMNANMNMNMGSCMPMGNMMGDNMGCCQMCEPIYECPEEKICHRFICYEVPHIKPCNTRIINHHVYRHTFSPYFTSCEENVVENVFDRKCC